MATFIYKAFDKSGKKTKGELEASSQSELNSILAKQNQILISAKLKRQSKLFIELGSKIQNKDIIQLCIHMEQLLDAGVNMLDGLEDVKESTGNKKLKNILTNVTKTVSEGSSLSKAFEKHSDVFGFIFPSLISAGEESGNLVDSFSQLINHYKRREKTKNMIKKAVTYPIIMIAVMFLIFYFMLVAVVPQLVSLLTSLGQELPIATKALIAVSDFASQYKIEILIFPVLILILYKIGSLFEKFNLAIDKLILKIPFVGETIEKINISRFSHFFGLMFESGIPILQGLDSANQVISNKYLKDSFDKVKDAVEAGNALSSSMKKWGSFPPLVIRMIKVGEDSGRLEKTLKNVTDFYDREVEDTIEALIGFLKVGLIVIVGIFVLWIVLSVIAPIYDSLQNLGI